MQAASDLTQLKKRLQRQRHKAIQRFRLRPRSEHLLRRLSTYTDQCLTQLTALKPLPAASALIAVGGYGRQELYPFSDVDILILLHHPPSLNEQHAIEQFIAALWDIGIKAASSVRTIAQCLEAAEADIATQTAQLEARFITGHLKLFKQLQKSLEQQLEVKTFFQAKLAEMRQRHAHYQNTPYALEPNCKESPGALRDLQILLWLAKAMGLGDSWQQIAQAQLLSPAELRAITRASAAFMRLRIELHLLSQRAEDRLLFDYQPELARIYGFTGKDKQQASEKLMQRYYWAARTVHQMNTILMQNLEEILFSPQPPVREPINAFFEVRNQRLHLRQPEQLQKHPDLILRAFLLLQQRGDLHHFSAQTLRALWHARRLINESFRQQPLHQQLFLAILQQPRGVLHALRLMNMLNILPRYIPEFRHIVGQMQHDLFHVYTVDQHTLMVIRNLRRFTLAEYANDHPLASQLMDAFERPWVLYIAALFHDIAKGRGGNHAELGAQDALAFCQRHQLNAADTELIVFLVYDHLSMSMVAQKRDISDPTVIADFAKHVSTPRRLSALFLLTVADIKGTNPTIWNSWKAKLLSDLYTLTLRVLQGDQPNATEILAQRKAQALTQLLAQSIDANDIENLWDVFDISYFLRHECDEIVWHGQALHKALLHPHPVVETRPVGKGETIQIMIYTPDREDLFMHICAFFDQHHLNTQDARIYTTNHGWALDSFVLLLPRHQRYTTSFAKTIQHQLCTFLQHPQTSFDTAPRYLPQTQSRRARVFPIAPIVDIQPMSQPHTWKISIICADRKGLLYSIAQAFTAQRINVKSAKIMTLGERVEDTFIVHSDELHHTAFFKQFERALRSAL